MQYAVENLEENDKIILKSSDMSPGGLNRKMWAEMIQGREISVTK